MCWNSQSRVKKSNMVCFARHWSKSGSLFYYSGSFYTQEILVLQNPPLRVFGMLGLMREAHFSFLALYSNQKSKKVFSRPSNHFQKMRWLFWFCCLKCSDSAVIHILNGHKIITTLRNMKNQTFATQNCVYFSGFSKFWLVFLSNSV